MLSKYFIIAGRVAPPLVEYVASQQQFASVNPMPEGLLIPVLIHRGEMSGGVGGMRGTPPLLQQRRQGDWTCVCGFSNFSSRNACFGCQRPRSVESKVAPSARPGDWSCPCGTHNFARRTTCMTCEAPKPSVGQYPAGGERVLPGDWHCGACDAHNFRSRTACIKCGEKKSIVGGSEGLPLGVPWTCTACHTANPSGRKDCEICGARRTQVPNREMSTQTEWGAPATATTTPTQSGATPKKESRPGDWNCTQCSFTNFATRTVCRSCASMRPEETGAAAPRAPQELKKGDWTCSSCGCHNFARRLKCFECLQVRPVVSVAAVHPSTEGGASSSSAL